MKILSFVMCASLLAGTGACSSLGYGGGAVAAVSGAALIGHATMVCEESAIGCLVLAPSEFALGAGAVITGLVTIGMTALVGSSGSERAPAAGAPAAAPEVWPAPSPSRSPSAPSGSPLAPAQSVSMLPTRAALPGAAAGTRSLMSFR